MAPRGAQRVKKTVQLPTVASKRQLPETTPMPRWLAAVLGVLVLATLALLLWSLSAGPEPVAIAGDNEPVPEKAAVPKLAEAHKPTEPEPEPKPQVAAAGGLRGQVHDSTGQGVTAVVRVLNTQGQAAGRGTSDQAGTFVLAQLPPGVYRVEVQASNFALWRQDRVQIRGGQTETLDVTLAASEPIRGVVVNDRGSPVPHAYVIRVAPGDPVMATADVNGEFVIGAEAAGAEVIAVHGRYAASNPVKLEVKPPTGMRLQLQAGALVLGMVVDHKGLPVANAQVAVEVAAYDGPAVASPTLPPVTTQADGRFELGRLRPGTFDLRADAPGKAAGFAKNVRATAGGTTSGLVITLGAGAVIKGRVTAKATGKPVGQARVAVLDGAPGMDPPSTTTDNDGRYEIHAVAAGLHSLRVDHPEFRAEMVSGINAPENGEVVRDIALAVKVAGENFAFQGIGAGLQKDGDAVIVRNVMPDTPAAQAGMQSGDRIVSVDRQGVNGMPLTGVIERIRGEEGTTVLIEIDRPGQGRFTVQVSRAAVVVKEPR